MSMRIANSLTLVLLITAAASAKQLSVPTLGGNGNDAWKPSAAQRVATTDAASTGRAEFNPSPGDAEADTDGDSALETTNALNTSTSSAPITRA